MPYNASTGLYTPPLGAENAAVGQIIQPTTWNSIFTDISTALTSVGEIVLPGVTNAIWNTFSPTVTTASGTMTSFALNAGRYVQVGNLVAVQMAVSLTNVGSGGSGAVIMSLPIPATLGIPNGVALTGRENRLSKALIAGAQNQGSISINFADGTSAATNANYLVIGGLYESVS